MDLTPTATQNLDSILKHSGSIKIEKRVSIQNTNLSLAQIEQILEKPNQHTEDRSIKIPSGKEDLVSKNSSYLIKLLYMIGAPPVTLIITQNKGIGHFKLVRSSSVDYDDLEGQHNQNSHCRKSKNQRDD